MTQGTQEDHPREHDRSIIEIIKEKARDNRYRKGLRSVIGPIAKFSNWYRRLLGPIIEHLFAIFLFCLSVYEIISEKKLPDFPSHPGGSPEIYYLSCLSWWLFSLFLASIVYMVLQNVVSNYKSIVILDRDAEVRAHTLALERKDVTINELRMEGEVSQSNFDRATTSLQKDIEEGDKQSTGVLNLVACQFRELEECRQAFDSLLLRTISEVHASGIDFHRERLGELRIELRAEMIRIADAAVAIFNAAKRLPPNETVGFNIKLFSGDNTDPQFSVVVRAGYRRDDRQALDKENLQKHGQLTVRKHAIYNALLYGSGRLKSHLCVANKRKYIRAINSANRDGAATYVMPDDYFDQHYQCSLLVPIRGSDATLLDGGVQTGVMPIKVNEDCLLGLVCVDFFPRPDFFGTSFDVDVMRQLATHIFNTLRAYHGTVLLCSTMSRKRVKTNGTGRVNGSKSVRSSRVGVARGGRNKASKDNEQQA